MAKYFDISTKHGKRAVFLLKKFSYKIQGEKFWFAIHSQDMFGLGMMVLSEWNSGKKVAELRTGVVYINRPVNQMRDAAKRILDGLIVKHGPAKVRSILSGH